MWKIWSWEGLGSGALCLLCPPAHSRAAATTATDRTRVSSVRRAKDSKSEHCLMRRKRRDGKKGEVLEFVRSGCWFALLLEERLLGVWVLDL